MTLYTGKSELCILETHSRLPSLQLKPRRPENGRNPSVTERISGGHLQTTSKGIGSWVLSVGRVSILPCT